MARTEPSPTAPPGSVLLRQHIDTTGTSIPAFAVAAGIDRTQVQRLVEGSGAKRVSVITATRIERASGGAVPVSAWAVEAGEAGEDIAAVADRVSTTINDLADAFDAAAAEPGAAA